MIKLILIVLFQCGYHLVASDGNGLGLTPVMGFMNWERFRCQTDCVNFPNECINENLFMTMADAMVTFGLKDAGYTYLSIDDCWLMKNRSADGQLVADPDRFPSGMKALADYMHERGLKLGIYEDVGYKTCAGYPGSKGHIETDAQTFASWGIDMLKFDGCYIDPLTSGPGYKEMGKALNNTGRDILYLCEWPLYDPVADYAEVAETCNFFRNYDDVQDSWDSLFGIIKHYANNQNKFAKHSGPGHFLDPDELLVGNSGTSFGQQKIQMAMWCMWSAPLLVSSDLRFISDAALSLLLNRYLIRINQDPLGDFAKQVISDSNGAIQVWLKKLGDATFGTYAICNFHAKSDDQTVLLSYSLKDLGVKEPESGETFTLIDAFTGTNFGDGPVSWDDKIDLYVPDFDAVVLIVKLQQKLNSPMRVSQKIEEWFKPEVVWNRR